MAPPALISLYESHGFAQGNKFKYDWNHQDRTNRLVEEFRDQLHFGMKVEDESEARLLSAALWARLQLRETAWRRAAAAREAQLTSLLRRLQELEARMRSEQSRLATLLAKKDNVIARQHRELQRLKRRAGRAAAAASVTDDKNEHKQAESRPAADPAKDESVQEKAEVGPVEVAAEEAQEAEVEGGGGGEEGAALVVRMVRRFEDLAKATEKEEKHDSGRESEEADHEDGLLLGLPLLLPAASSPFPSPPSTPPPPLPPSPTPNNKDGANQSVASMVSYLSTTGGLLEATPGTPTLPKDGNYEKFLDATGLSQKPLVTPSRLLSNHRAVLKPRDVKHKHRLRAMSATPSSSEGGPGANPGAKPTTRYWTEPFL